MFLSTLVGSVLFSFIFPSFFLLWCRLFDLSDVIRQKVISAAVGVRLIFKVENATPIPVNKMVVCFVS